MSFFPCQLVFMKMHVVFDVTHHRQHTANHLSTPFIADTGELRGNDGRIAVLWRNDPMPPSTF